MAQWIDKELIPILKPTALDEVLLAFDAASFHKTLEILQTFRNNHIIPALVPSGCTGLLQPLDTAVNKPFKELLWEQTERYMDAREDAGDDVEKWSVSQKWIMVTHVVVEAWTQFCKEKKSLIEKSFVNVGLNIASDGSEDSKLSIKGYEHGKLEIGDWSKINKDDCIEGFQEIPLEKEELDEYIQKEEHCITTNYRGLQRKRLEELIKKRGLPYARLRRAEMVEVLQKDDQFSQLHCTEWQVENYCYCNSNSIGRFYSWKL
jgi:hypothetical protein